LEEEKDKPLLDLVDTIHLTENISAKIHGLRDESVIFQTVSDEFAKSGRYLGTVLLLTEDGSYLKVLHSSLESPVLEAMEKAAGMSMEQYRIDISKSTMLSQVIREGKTIRANSDDILREMFPRPFDTALEKLMKVVSNPSLLTPLHRHGKPIGVLTMTFPSMAEHLVPFARNLADHISSALELADEHADRKRAEELFTTMAVNTQVGTYIAQNGVFQFVNPAFQRDIGFSENELLGKSCLSIVHPEDRELVRNNAADMLKGTRDTGYEFRIITKDGTNKYALEKVVTIDYNGKPATLGSFMDTTDRKRAEEEIRAKHDEVEVHAYQLEAANEELRQTQGQLLEANDQLSESEEKYRSIIENAGTPITYYDPDGNIVLINTIGAALLGGTPEELIGKSVYEALPNIADAARERTQWVMRSGRGKEYEDYVELPTGKRWFMSNVQPVKDADGEIFAIQVISQEITERKEAEQRVEHLNTLLLSIRKIDQLIVREKDPETLIQTACNILIGTRGYHGSWIALIDESGALGPTAEAGLGDNFLPLMDRMRTGVWPDCTQIALAQDNAVAFNNSLGNCSDCPMLTDCCEKGSLTVRLQHGEDAYGVIYVSGSSFDTPDNEERPLMEEVAGDIAFALYNVKLEEERQQTEEEIRAQHEDILVHSYELEAANDELRHTQNQLIEANQKLRESEAKYRNIFESANDEILYLDRSGKVLDVNRKVADIFGYRPEEVVGKKFSDLNLISSHHMPSMTKWFSKVMEGGSTQGLTELQAKHKDGRSVFIEASISPIVKQGRTEGLMAVVRDVTERKQMEDRVTQYSDELEQRLDELQKAYEKLQELDKMKDNFLSTVSHELRTPLTSIKSFTEILLTYEDDKETQREFLNIINDESDRLTRLINDFLDISKIESGHVQWETDILNISEIVETAVNSTQALSAKADLTVNVDLAPDLPNILGDRDRLVQVVTNLISNAIKFTPEGGNIRLTSEIQAGEASYHVPDIVKISVNDNGMGIASEDEDHIFDKFIQVGDTLRNKPPGTGLGLAICKEIVEHHGGTIWVESELAKGSTFSFTLIPIGPDSTEEKTDTGKALSFDSIKSGGTILVVDDEANIRRFLSHELAKRGYRVIEASNGNDAIHAARNHSPDLITLDVLMPDISGLDVTAVLRSDPETKDIPILIISVMEYQGKAFKLGANDYVTKPCNVEHLMDRINRLLQNLHGSIMVIDDDKSLVKSIKYELEKRGFSTFVAHGGEEASDILANNQPDLIILDMVMPQMDGYGVIEKLKTNPGTADTPIVILSGVEIEGGREAALSLGATEYITKSGSMNKLFETVASILRRHQSAN
jgi:PAS domain S-box-containing protein